MMLASLETQSGLAPGSHRTGVTNRCAALATTVGMVAGVHDGTTAAGTDRKSTRLNSSHSAKSRMPSSA